MFDIILEVLIALVLLAILLAFVRMDKDIEYNRRGWLYIQLGFLLLLFGAFLDITDNFESLNWALVIGDTKIEAFLEKAVGSLGGFILLAIGFRTWLPTIKEMTEIKRSLRESRNTLEYKVSERTHELEKEIDHREAVEAALRQAEERRQMLFESAPVSIIHGLIGGHLVERNLAFANMLGYGSAEELQNAISESGNKGYTWHDQNDLIVLIERLKREKLIRNFETRFNAKDGSILWVRFHFTTLPDRKGVNYYFYGFAEDITERKKITDALAQSERRLKTIMDSLPAGMFVVDTRSRLICDANPAALAMTGYTYDELVGFHCCDKLCPKTKEDPCPVIERGWTMYNRERTMLRKDGSEMPVLKSVSRMHIDDAEYLLETFIDISDQKQMEQLKEDVDRIVRHDLKSPVIGMLNSCTLLLMEDSITGETRELLEVIEQQGKKVLRMIGMSMSIYKMEAGTYHYDPIPIDFMDVVRRVTGELGEMARGMNVRLEILVGGNPAHDAHGCMVTGEDILYDSMLANLLSNAIEASPFGGTVTVTIDCGHAPILTVTNEGVVPPEVRSNFFDKYATAGKRGGTGLGTYSARLVTRTIGGEIEMATSDAENRTTLTVRLPGATEG